MHIEGMSAAQIFAVLINREDFSTSIDHELLADKLIDNDNSLAMFGTGTMIDALNARKGVDMMQSPYDWNDYCVSIEKGQMNHRTGKATILIVEGLY